MSNELMVMELRMALTSLNMALALCESEQDRSTARYEIFESTEGMIALEMLEDRLGLCVADRDDVLRGFGMVPLTAELLQPAVPFAVDEARINEIEMWRGPRPDCDV